MSIAELIWVEKYRPSRIDDIIDQEEVKDRVRQFLKAGNMPHMLFYGPPGTGKTTMALAIAHELYGDAWRENVLELNASDERGITTIRERVKEFARTAPMGKAPYKLIILDEADNMTSDAQQALRRMMEMYANITRFILIANYVSRIIDPIQSRCAMFRFSPLPRDAVLGRLRDIASREGVKVTDEALEAIWDISQGDMRRAINTLQAAAATSREITPEVIYKTVGYIEPKDIVDLVNTAFSGDFIKAREKLRALMYEHGVSGTEILRAIQRQILSGAINVPEEAKVEVAEIAADIDYRLTEGSDEEIQLSAFLARLMLVGKKYGLGAGKEASKETKAPSKRR
ncbi:ATPase AAA [Vulcanisaeta souniana JCM 11219]|uniref:Replication factor C small subunit n=1 Tax=Vulcanisaeta souniana JCM 11219 TaxID=1293586 RepID=A0A830EI10_9CREN|nr:ATPase AAA [Vulcanisaeta souniana JCM 11219]GGI78599.1 ATPase AAA [Vulcanisaeta souniana JCM 11219]